MKQEDCVVPTRPFLNRRELDPYLKNVFPAGFCKNKHMGDNSTLHTKRIVEVAMPQVSTSLDNGRDFISVFKRDSCEGITEKGAINVDGGDEYADVAGPFFRDSQPLISHIESHKKSHREKKLRKDKVIPSETVYQPTAVFPALHARPVLTAESCASPRKSLPRESPTMMTLSDRYIHQSPPDEVVLNIRSYDQLFSCSADTTVAVTVISVHANLSLSALHRQICSLFNKETLHKLKLWHLNAHGQWFPLRSELTWEKIKMQNRQDSKPGLDILYSMLLESTGLPPCANRTPAVNTSPTAPSPVPPKLSFYMMTDRRIPSKRNTSVDPAKLNVMAKTLEQRIVSGGY